MPVIKYWRPADLEPVNPNLPTRQIKVARFPTFGWPLSTIKKKIAKWDNYGDDQPDLHDGGGGIKVVVDQPEYKGLTDRDDNPLDVPHTFAAYTVMCLRLLYGSQIGRKVLDYLLLNGDITIQYSFSNNACRGSPIRHSIAEEIFNINTTALNSTRAALRMKWSLDDMLNATRLANEINALCLKQKLTLDAFHKQQGKDLKIKPDELNQWITKGTKISRLSEEDEKQLKLATVAILDGLAKKAPTPGASIQFCTRPDSQLNLERPPSIGLFHELVHAYFYVRGEQPGADTGHYSTTLFEFKCVGIGPWRHAVVSENKLRSQWSHVVAVFGNQIDDLHDKQVAPRLQY